MKTVFASNDQVAHVWAQQTQSTGCAGNMFFRDSTIFSYGEHYAIAHIHTNGGKRFALVNSNRSSVTTEGKHKRAVRSALNGLMNNFPSPDVNSPKAAVKHLDSLASESIKTALSKMKITSKSDLDWEMGRVEAAYTLATRLRHTLGLKGKYPKPADLVAIRKHLEKRLARYKELNTPEIIAKRQADKIAKAAKDNEIAIAQFRSGERNTVDNLPTDLLRIQGDEVVTSRGARVSVQAATLLYRAVESGRDVLGMRVGDFTVVSVTRLADGVAVKIGCHTILLSEARALLGVRQTA